MKKAVILAPLGVAAVGAVLFFAMKKPAGEKSAAPKKAAPGKSGGKAKAPAGPKDPKTGSYSFISGFKDARTVEVSVEYDAAAVGYAVISEDFLTYSSNSHVGAITGDEYSIQIEYAGFYSGEDFAGLKKSLGERYQDVKDVAFGANKGLQFIDGDNVCMAFPVDAFSYLLVTIIKGKEYDDPFTTLPDYPPVAAILSSIKIA